MGNRVTVSISADHTEPVNIYAHWAGDQIYSLVQEVLEISDRIGDGSYLTAQIINAVFTQSGYDGSTGFGIWAGEASALNDDNPTMFVDAMTGTWRIGDSDWYDRTDRVGDVSF